MYTSKMVKDFLAYCCRIEDRIKGSLDEIDRLDSLAERMTASYSDMPRGGDQKSGPIDRAVPPLIDLKGELLTNVDRMVLHRRKAHWMVENLSDTRYQDILSWRYFSQWPWDKIAEAMHYDRMQVWRLHGRALVEAQTLLESSDDVTR